MSTSAAATLDKLLDLDSLLSPEDLDLRSMVRQFGEQRLRPHIADWFETAHVPVRDLAVEIGKLGLLGMHLTGYGCGGSTATAYGLVCQELEAVDSGLRSLVSVQGSLSMRTTARRHGGDWSSTAADHRRAHEAAAREGWGRVGGFPDQLAHDRWDPGGAAGPGSRADRPTGSDHLGSTSTTLSRGGSTALRRPFPSPPRPPWPRSARSPSSRCTR